MFRQSSSPQPASHTLFVSLYDMVSVTRWLTSAHMNTHTHTYLNGVMAGSLEIWGWMRLDGDCPTYCCYLGPQTGRGHSLPLSSLPVSSARSVLTGWHVHSCLLPPAAAYSKAHTSLWSYRFDFCHFIFQFPVGSGMTDHTCLFLGACNVVLNSCVGYI